ncbi:hypothetical protein COCCADRAFT_2333 [Bipolaris zeicola 26-R-13]|uniref:Uncharacterized protein n=1 Tax=Cochliobolus carbonum (strain 26-R-13) TaxID=930089 RepID=W6YB76_COCC2|nr:uncharacterized protein COCCADRAFT_2333 [Bipolaris zeicola 26-R-13]EUC36682.1 hypothetical protein COCCADRAFT_2333 [Bipolaris zeicola 26-R-13]
MDVLKWLEETEQHPVPQDACKPKSKSKRLPRRAKSDSSLLEPLPLQDSPVQQRARKQTARDVLVASSSASSTSSLYARKPRRKTRPERYEPNKPEHAGRNNSSKKARHKSRRRKVEKSGQVVRNFKAKNVSGDRLTLKPPELGLFNKGRTSIAVRGRGLPDLVFSEMKFLHKHEEPKPPPQPDVPRKKRKIDHTHTKDGEISTFFTTDRHTLAQKVQDKPASHSSVREKKRRHHYHSPTTDVAIPTVEPADQMFLPHSDIQYPRHESTRCVSWSESIRALSTTSAHHQADDDAPHEWHDSDRYGHCKSKMKRPERTFKQPELPSVAKQTTDDTAGYFRVSSLAPSHSRMSRSQSCPQQASSPKRVNLVDRSAKLQPTGAAYSSSSMPPAVPAYPSTDAGLVLAANRSNSPRFGKSSILREIRPVSQHQVLDDGYNNCGEDQETSSDLEKVLQVCKDTLYNQRRAAPSPRNGANRSEHLLPMQSADQPRRTSWHMPTQRIPTVRFAQLPVQYHVQPTFSGPSIYEQQEQHQYQPLRVSGNEALGDDPWAFEQEYMDDDMAICYNDVGWNDTIEASILNELGDSNEMYVAEGAFGVDHIGEDSWPSNNHDVAPGFWRPNKLY